MSSIRNRLLLVLLEVGFLPLLLVFTVSKSITSRDLEASEREKLSAVAREIARQVGSTMESTASDLESLRSNPVVIDPHTSMQERLDEMRRIVKAYSNFSDITIYDPDGIMVETTTTGRHPEPLDTSAWLVTARDEGILQTSTPHRVLGHPGLHVKVYIPLHITGQTRASVLKARLTFDSIWDLIDGAAVGEEGEMFIVDSHGKILACRDKNLILERFDSRFPTAFWTRHPEGNYTDPQGREFAYNAQTLSDRQTHVGERWVLLSMLPREELTAALQESERFQFLAAGIALLIATVLGLTLSRRLADPVILASKAARRVARGDLETAVPETGPLEMRQLAASFNQMIEEVKGARSHLESLVESRTEKLVQSQSELEDLASQLRAAYESTREAILVVRPDGAIITANRRIQEFFAPGDTEPLATLPFKLLQVKLQPLFAKKDPKRWNFFELNPDGVGETEWEISGARPRTLSVYTAPVKNQSAKAIARLWMFSDITEQRQLEQSLQQAQKMEAVGRLAGGVAHDFNNLLTGIIGNLALAQMESERGGESNNSQRFISSARKAGERAADLVKQLLGFSRRSHLQLKRTDVNDLIVEIQELLTHTIDPRIRIEADLPPALWEIDADPTQIQQVLMNLCVNATDAIGEEGGRISLSTRNIHLSSEQAARITGAAPGPYVRICVEDNGQGMSEEVQEKIFEPFFTTKEPGKGTGLGLATSYGIVRQHGGWISCESRKGVGTTFHIFLPRIKKSSESPPAPCAKRPEIEKQDATVLLVDDEEMVRTVGRSALARHGYHVLLAGDGEEALRICQEKPGEIDVIVLDLTMPKLSGRDTFLELQKMQSPPPVVICSGYTIDLNEFEKENGARPAGFVQKPFDINEIAASVQAAIRPVPAQAA